MLRPSAGVVTLLALIAGVSSAPAGEARPARQAGYNTTILVTGPGSGHPWRSRVAAARRYAGRRAGWVSFAVVGEHGRLRGHRAARRFYSASTVKVMLMIAYLRSRGVRGRALRRRDFALMGPMIRRSDNHTASLIRNLVGNDALRRLAHAARMRDFSTHPTWGLSRITARDQARFMWRFRRYVPRRHRRYASHLLAGIVDRQRWGMPGAVPDGWSIYFKGGFVPGWRIHQIAQLRRGKRRLGIAVLTDGNPSLLYGAQTIEGVTRRLLAGYGSPNR